MSILQTDFERLFCIILDYRMLTPQAVRKKLTRVIDPELQVNIVDLGLVYNIKVQKGEVKILMTLTTPGCPLSGIFEGLIQDALRDAEGFTKLSVELTFDPPWTPELMSDEAKASLGF